MKPASATVVLLSFLCTLPVFGQQATREEWKEFTKMMAGRWVGEVTWVADWAGLGKRGEKATCYWESMLVQDGNAMTATFFGGTGSSTSLIFFEPGTKRIRWISVESGGRVNEEIMYKKDGKWFQQGTGFDAKGAKIEYLCQLTISDGGDRYTWTGSGTVAGKKTDERHDVWRRVSK